MVQNIHEKNVRVELVPHFAQAESVKILNLEAYTQKLNGFKQL